MKNFHPIGTFPVAQSMATWCCFCSGSGSIPGPGTSSIGCECSQKKKKKVPLNGDWEGEDGGGESLGEKTFFW